MTIARDGTAVSGTSGTGTLALPTLTASLSGEIIVATGGAITNEVTGVSAPGLGSFTLRSRLSTFGFSDLCEWFAPYTGGFSGTITVTGGANPTVAIAQAYSGITSPYPFDVNGPNTSTNPPTSITTVNPNNLVYSICSCSGTDSASGIWNQVAGLSSGNFLLMMDVIVSSAGTYLTTTTNSLVDGNIVDTMTAAPSSAILLARIMM